MPCDEEDDSYLSREAVSLMLVVSAGMPIGRPDRRARLRRSGVTGVDP